jgi:3-dehydro-L-gulonate 2-dehydrogenase
MLAAMLSGGLAAHQIPPDPFRETGLSQVFLAIDPGNLVEAQKMADIAEGILASLRDATSIDPVKPVRYPGEQTLKLREENMRLGVPVDPEIWRQLNPSVPSQ